MKTRKIQWGLIIFGTLLFWGYHITNTVALSFSPRSQYDVCFSPKGHCERKLVHLIAQADHNITLFFYSFTSQPITQALIKAQRRGVQVEIIADRDLFNPANRHSRIRQIVAHHIPVWVDNTVNIQHNKTMIIDKKIIETGSYNYTVSANRYNAENILIIHDPTLAKKYLAYWHERQQVSTPANIYRYKKKAYRSRSRHGHR